MLDDTGDGGLMQKGLSFPLFPAVLSQLQFFFNTKMTGQRVFFSKETGFLFLFQNALPGSHQEQDFSRSRNFDASGKKLL